MDHQVPQISQEELDALRELRGLVATVVLTGTVDEHFAQHLSNLRSWCDRSNFHNIEWAQFQAQLVEAGRDSAMVHALDNGYDWVLQIDADAAPIPDLTLYQLLADAYILSDADVVGAYCQLKTKPHLPTIDTGTGTWEPIFPGRGLVPVIRTGGHCLLVKTRILSRFGPPWFKTRRTITPLDVLSELDNYARCKLDGENPLRESEAWGKLAKKAAEDHAATSPAHVGEDSGFCDAVKAVGGEILVDTNVVVGHVGKKVYSPRDLRDALKEKREANAAICGVY